VAIDRLVHDVQSMAPWPAVQRAHPR
jgi:hypothetical protein